MGDTSRNTDGAFCESPGEPWDGQPCEFEHSTCGNKTEDCHGRGPGFRISDFESNRIIGELQFEGARSVMESSLVDVAEPGVGRTKVTGPVRSVHVYLNMCVLRYYCFFELKRGERLERRRGNPICLELNIWSPLPESSEYSGTYNIFTI